MYTTRSRKNKKGGKKGKANKNVADDVTKHIPEVNAIDNVSKKSEDLEVESKASEHESVKDSKHESVKGSIQTSVRSSKKREAKKNAQKAALELKAAEEMYALEKRLIEAKLAAAKAEIDAENDDETDIDLTDAEIEPSDINDGDEEEIEVAQNMNQTPEEKLASAILTALSTGNRGSTKTDDNTMFLRRQAVTPLPSFSGKPERWPLFYAQFKRSTELCKFTNVENLLRLNKCLEGEAKEAVESMLLTTEDAETVIKALELQFGRPDMVVKAIIKKIKEMPNIKDERVEKLVEFYNGVQGLVSTMTHLNAIGHMNNPQLLSDLNSKLPTHLKLQWGITVAEKEGAVNLNDFATWLGKQARGASMVFSDYSDTTEYHASSSRRSIHETRKDGKSFNKKASTVLTVIEEETNCPACDGKHALLKCTKFSDSDPDKRWEMATRARLCFRCLGRNHRAQICKKKGKCGKDGCKCTHHPLLHKDLSSIKRTEISGSKNDSSKTETTEVVTHTSQLQESVALKVLPIILTGPKGEMHTYALLDEGSTITLLDETVANELGLKGPTETLRLKWTDDTTKQVHESRRVEVQVRGEDEEMSYNLKGVKTVNDLNLPVHTMKTKDLQRKWGHLRHAIVKPLDGVKPKILLGQDNCQLIVSSEAVIGPPNSPVLSRTKLGWVIHGTINKVRSCADSYSFHIRQEDNDLHELVKSYFTTEQFGVQVPTTKLRSPQDDRAIQICKERMTYKEGRWETALLWKNDDIKLPESKKMATERLKSLERKLKKDDNLAEEYKRKMNDYLAKDYARKLNDNEIRDDEKSWYLPHFGVINPNKTERKLRLVFDAAAKSGGKSLNDFLLSGPDLLNSLPATLFKFRQREIAICGDIREMFHQVRIRDEDCSAQRFLWRDLDVTREPEIWEMKVMMFGTTCSPFLAQEAKNRNAMVQSEEFPEAAKAIIERHYMDDYLDSLSTEEEAIKLAAEVIEVHRRGGFEIRNWISNSKAVLESIPQEKHAQTGKTIEETGNQIDKILGLTWDSEKDEFRFLCSVERIRTLVDDINERPTKRKMLRVLMSLFDPLGFLTPFTIKGKILLQDVWRSKIGWDDELTDTLFDKWKSWIDDFTRVNEFAIPRCYASNMTKPTSRELHIFCDASEKAFAACAYLRITNSTDIKCSLIASRPRVAPLRPLSIPRLELQAAILATRLAISIREAHEIQIERTYFWSDSKTVICWINSDARNYKQFVSHRIGEILESTNPDEWRWLPTNENVADEGTRDVGKPNIERESRWVNGPKFLYLPESSWPEDKTAAISDEENTIELKQEFVGAVNEVTTKTDFVINPEDYSKWIRLIRVTAWVKRFTHNLLVRVKGGKIKEKELTVAELQAAENLWIKTSQKESFPKENLNLMKGKEVTKDSKLIGLNPVLDDQGIIRLKGRLQNAKIPDGVKTPIILDPKHAVTKLLLMFYHERLNHQGREQMLNELRQRFWVLRGRSAIKSTFGKCNKCKLLRSRPTEPMMGDLPEGRLDYRARPFDRCGIDYFGPYQVSVGRRKEKRWGVMFTCMTVRAIHIEVAHRLTTDSAIMAIRKMAARRGYPSHIYSDNGTNLRGADAELRRALEELNQDEITSRLAIKGVTWHFNPPAAPHMGGCWERLIKSVKSALKVTLKEKNPNDETLSTLLIEAEGIINGRPLTHVSLDHADDDALTPNHFLIGTSNVNPLIGRFDDSDLITRRGWRTSQRLTDMFWKRWLKEYLPSLSKRDKWTKTQESLKIDDVVVIADPDLPRNVWPKGKVIKVFPGKDGQIRVVEVKTCFGSLKRPVHKLCKIDIR